MTPTDWNDLLRTGGPAAPFVIFVIGLLRQWWVMGTQHREMQIWYQERLQDVCEERDRYRELALGAVDIGQQTVEQISQQRGRR